MNLDGMRVNHAALDQAAADLQQTVRQMDARLERLASELEPLRSDWAGSAQQSYLAAKAQWDRAIGEMRDLLDQTRVTVQQSNAEYAAADRRGAAAFQL